MEDTIMMRIKKYTDIDTTGLTAKQACRLATTPKEFMIQYQDKIHLTDEPYAYIMTRMPNVLASEVEIYQLK